MTNGYIFREYATEPRPDRHITTIPQPESQLTLCGRNPDATMINIPWSAGQNCDLDLMCKPCLEHWAMISA